jgi:hypothetical protein
MTTIFEWHLRLKAGRVSVEDDECSGRPSTSKTTENVEKIRAVECQLKMTNVQGDQAPAKRQKMLKKFENSSMKTSPSNP